MKLIGHHWSDQAIFTIYKKPAKIYHRVQIFYGDENNSPILKGGPWWRDITGGMVQFKWGRIEVQFRRFEKRRK